MMDLTLPPSTHLTSAPRPQAVAGAGRIMVALCYLVILQIGIGIGAHFSFVSSDKWTSCWSPQAEQKQQGEELVQPSFNESLKQQLACSEQSSDLDCSKLLTRQNQRSNKLHTLTREALRELFEKKVEKDVKYNNWIMGCADLTILAPYFRAISDKQYWTGGSKRTRLIFDVGANNGDDAEAVLGAFHKIVGMCKHYAVPFTLISVEPSPSVFCELDDLAKEKGWKPPAQNMLRLNVALSHKSSFLKFRDPGHEGGKLLGGSNEELSLMTAGIYANVTKCGVPKEIKHTIDESRITVVPTYTMDLLVSSLQGLNLTKPEDDVFILKIDTEGHDVNVLLGSKHLLKKKRITFVIFETAKNSLTRRVAEHMAAYGYLCFLIFPDMLVPLHTEDWWYSHMDKEFHWWGNGFCGIRDSKSLEMLWRMFHSHNSSIANAYELL
jgi:FkbM family methyltransferase